jgi:hypothetical protein
MRRSPAHLSSASKGGGVVTTPTETVSQKTFCTSFGGARLVKTLMPFQVVPLAKSGLAILLEIGFPVRTSIGMLPQSLVIRVLLAQGAAFERLRY